MQNDEGKWAEAGGGLHFFDGEKRYEQHLYQTTPEFVGWTAGFEFSATPDSLMTKGPASLTNAEGEDILDQFPNGWEESRIRIE